jgi:SprB-like repeat protein/type IX secretion system substrate protein
MTKLIHHLIFLILVFVANIVSAQFVNCYAPGNWTIVTVNTTGSVTFNGTTSVTIISDDDYTGFGGAPSSPFDCQETDGLDLMCITMPSTGTITFNWTYDNQYEQAGHEPLGYCINSDNFVSVVSYNGVGFQSGTTTINVNAGDYVCIGIGSYYAELGPATAVITNFSGPSCSTPLNVTLSNNGPLLCNGDTTGQLIASVTGGSTPYSYVWNTGDTTDTISNVAAGIYCLTVTDANGDSITACDTLTEPSALTANMTDDKTVSCYGGFDGQATAHTSGGTPPYSFLWDSGETDSTAMQLNAGTHNVTITDANNCELIASVNITQPFKMTGVVFTTPENNHNADGTASVNVNGGTPPYTYQWSTNPVQTTATATGLPSGNYLVTVTDTNGCFIIKAGFVLRVTYPLPLSVSNNGPLSCNGDMTGMAMASVSGGTLPYSYAWSNTNINNDTLFNLGAGTYCVTVTDAVGDTAIGCTTILEPSKITAITTEDKSVTCYGQSNGIATVSASGGTPGYTYLWDNNETGATATALNASTHNVTVTDSNSCTTVSQVVITEPNALSSTLTIVPETHFNGDGSATANVTGGTPPYQYVWSTIPPQTTATASNLSAGTYYLTITDSNNCVLFDTAVVTRNLLAISVSIVTTDPKCFGDSSGMAVAVASLGTPPYTYQWGNNATTDTISGLPAGNYCVTVTDALGDTTTACAVLNQPLELKINVSQDMEVKCFGGNDGKATAQVTGGIQPYQYSWDNGESGAKAIQLTAGVHKITVTDRNTCTVMGQVTISQPAQIVTLINTTPEIDKNANGSASVTVQGGTPPFTYLWNTNPPQTTATINNLVAGTYIVTITDAKGCFVIHSAVISRVSSAMNLTFSSNSPLNCFDDNNGTTKVTVTGGTPPYTYLWSNNATTDSIGNLGVNAYCVTVTDANNSTVVGCDTISSPPQITALFTIDSDIKCFGSNDGQATVSVSGGTPGYGYLWDNGQTTATAANLNGGMHTVTITDAANCTQTAQINMIEPAALTSTMMTTPEKNNDGDGTAKVICTGGTPPYSYVWNTTPPQTTDSISGLPAGTYVVTITDQNNCSTTDTAVIDRVTGINDVQLISKFNIFPNPGSGIFQMDLQLYRVSDIQITYSNAVGELLGSDEMNDTKSVSEIIDLSGYPAGIYWINIRIDGQTISKKVMLIK